MGNLYIVSTPIGNLQDISQRAIDILSGVNFVACEDTRKTGLLFKNLGIGKKAEFISYYEQKEVTKIPQIISIMKNGNDVALVSDAGTPLISDPGYKLVRACISEGIKLEHIPGPSSVISALVLSGLPPDKFLFAGYLPKKESKRKKFLEDIKSANSLIKTTVIFFESPHRILKSLEALHEVYGNIDIVIARELTKVHEEVRREKVLSSIEHFSKTKPRGEFVLLLHL